MLTHTLRRDPWVTGEVMREFEFDNEEAVLARDEAARRLFARVAPDVRRDMIGWIGWARLAAAFPSPRPTRDSRREMLIDYLSGAALVLNLLPNQQSEYIQSDADALASDLRYASQDMRTVAEAVDLLGRLKRDGRTKTTD